MAGSRNPGPVGHTSEVQKLNDGTMIRSLSPRPGPVGVGMTAMPVVDRLLQELRDASSGAALQRAAVTLLGPQCFSAGVIAGIGVDIVSSAADLLKLVGTFVLADLHDMRSGRVSWWRAVT